jgi:hypothetical protein
MDTTVTLEIAGLGVIFYSPRAAGHIGRGEDYLETHFWQPEDVARHVTDCQISGFGTGSPGRFVLRIYDGPIDAAGLEAAAVKARLGIEVHDGVLCFRDLYDLMKWEPDCAESQCVHLPSGFYRITAYTSMPESGVVGDGQTVSLHFEPCAEKPRLAWSGVPDLVPE